MLLGIARTADLAGWGTIAPSATTTVTTTATTNNSFLVTPRYYIDNPAVYYNGSILNVVVPPAGPQPMDQTGISTTGKQVTWAYTMRFGTNFVTTAPGSGMYGVSLYDRYNISTNTYFPRLEIGVVNGVYSLSTVMQTNNSPTNTTFNNFNSLRNTWLGVMASVSDTSSSFANWTGSGTGNGYLRTVISNVETGAILQQTDTVLFGTIFDRSLTNQYYLDDTGGSAYGYAPFWYPDSGDWSQYYQSDFDVASTWINWGSALDPAVYYSSLTGSAVATTIGGQQAWFAYNVDNGTNSSTGYSFNLPTGTRSPAGVTIDSNNFGNPNAAQLVAF